MRTIILKILAPVLLLLALTVPASAQSENGKILVLPFDVNAAPEFDYLKNSLGDLISDKLRQAEFTVAERESVRQLIEEQNVDVLNLKVARELALLSGADYALYGSFSQVGDTISIDARLVEAFGLKPVKPVFVVRDGLINLLPAVEELVERVSGEVRQQDIISNIEVRGMEVMDPEVVLMRLKIQKGDVLDRAQLHRELKRVYELGYFDDVQVSVEDAPEGKRVVFTVDEKPRIQAISIVGNDELDDDDIIAAMSTKAGGVLNFKVLSQDLNTIRELYRKEGYYLAEVNYEIEGKDEPQSRLNIVVKEGEKLYISNIEIKGAKEIDPDDLKDEMLTAERGFWSWLTGSGVLKEDVLERDSAAMEAYYANRGFVEAKVSQPEIEFKEDGIHLTFTVVEGERFKAGGVAFKGDLLEPDDKLLEITKIDDLAAEDEWFSRDVMHKDADRLARYYSDYGYAFADASADMNLDKDTHVITTTYNLKRNQKVYIGRVYIQGNSKTRDNVVRREMRVGDGELFSGSLLRRSAERLRKLDYFESVDIETVRTASPNELDLKVKVKEKTTGMISGGVGYSTYDKMFLAARIQERNLFGMGYQLGFSGTFSGRASRYDLSFTDPSFLDTRLSLGGDAYYRVEDFTDYDKFTVGARARFSYPIGEYSRLYWSYRLERYKIDDVEEGAAEAIKDIEGTNWASVIETTVVRDTTNSRLMPTEGSINTLRLEYGGGLLMGDDQFIKTVVETSWFFPLWMNHVFHWGGSAGMIFENFGGDSVPVYERFYLGGIDDVRGYGANLISPRDEASEDRIGGDKMWYMNFEYIFPLESDMGIFGVLFYDMGASLDDGEWDVFDMKKSVGAEIRWISPFGPLRFAYGYALDEVEEQGSKHKFEFSVGQAF